MSTRRIPDWLSHLRVDRRGLPVPYVNKWGDESLDRITVEHDPHVGMLAVFLHDEAETVPDFTRQNMQRQRECMVTGRCQVCHRQVPFSRRCLVVSSMSIDRVTINDLGEVITVTEPWLCRRCADFAVTRCPALIRRTSDDDLTIIPIRSPRDYRLAVSTGWVEGDLEEQTRADPPAMWVKAVLTRVHIEQRAPALMS